MLVRKGSNRLKSTSQVCMFQSLKSEAVCTNPFPLCPVDRYWSTTACLLGNIRYGIRFCIFLLSFCLNQFIHQVYTNLRNLDVFWNTLVQCLSSLAPVLAELLDIHLIYDTIILVRCHTKSEAELTQPDLRVLTNFNFVQKLWHNDFFCQLQHILSIHSSTHLDNPYAKMCFHMQ